MTTRNKWVGMATMRTLLGVIFFFQGFGKVFTWGVKGMYEMPFFYDRYIDILPEFLILGTAYYTSYIELIAGFFLIFGLKRDWCLYALASVLVLVSIGHGMVEPIWDLSHVIFRSALLIPLLLLPKEWDCLSLDSWLQNRAAVKEWQKNNPSNS